MWAKGRDIAARSLWTPGFDTLDISLYLRPDWQISETTSAAFLPAHVPRIRSSSSRNNKLVMSPYATAHHRLPAAHSINIRRAPLDDDPQAVWFENDARVRDCGYSYSFRRPSDVRRHVFDAAEEFRPTVAHFYGRGSTSRITNRMRRNGSTTTDQPHEKLRKINHCVLSCLRRGPPRLVERQLLRHNSAYAPDRHCSAQKRHGACCAGTSGRRAAASRQALAHARCWSRHSDEWALWRSGS